MTKKLSILSFILIAFLLNCRDNHLPFRPRNPQGLYATHLKSYEGYFGGEVLLFRHGTVKYLQSIDFVHLNFSKYLKNATECRFRINGDSIHFALDSIFYGFITQEYTVYGQHHLDSIPAYDPDWKMEFDGLIKNDSIILKTRDTHSEKVYEYVETYYPVNKWSDYLAKDTLRLH